MLTILLAIGLFWGGVKVVPVSGVVNGKVEIVGHKLVPVSRAK